jgi:hypothetical protein
MVVDGLRLLCDTSVRSFCFHMARNLHLGAGKGSAVLRRKWNRCASLCREHCHDFMFSFPARRTQGSAGALHHGLPRAREWPGLLHGVPHLAPMFF